jgi:hypothetical protein
MTTVVFSITHALTTDHDVDLPCESWEDVEEFYIKWNTLHIKIRNQGWIEIDLGDLDPSDLDAKRPASVDVFDAETYARLFGK